MGKTSEGCNEVFGIEAVYPISLSLTLVKTSFLGNPVLCPFTVPHACTSTLARSSNNFYQNNDTFEFTRHVSVVQRPSSVESRINLKLHSIVHCFVTFGYFVTFLIYYTFAIYLCSALHYKFKCNFKLILLSTEDGRCTTETCLVNSNMSLFL